MSRNKSADKKRIIERLKNTPIVELACKQVGIARATYYRWFKEDPEFASQCEVALEQSTATINDMAESQLISAIKEKNMSAISFWLRHHHKAYETRIKVDGHIIHETEALSPEQEELVTKALRMVGLLEASPAVSSEETQS